jgi:hypothetical protein
MLSKVNLTQAALFRHIQPMGDEIAFLRDISRSLIPSVHAEDIRYFRRPKPRIILRLYAPKKMAIVKKRVDAQWKRRYPKTTTAWKMIDSERAQWTVIWD